MVEIVSETYERLGMSDKAERVRLKYPAPVYRWKHSNDGSAKRVLVHRPFKAGVHNSSTRGSVVNYIHSLCMHYACCLCIYVTASVYREKQEKGLTAIGIFPII